MLSSNLVILRMPQSCLVSMYEHTKPDNDTINAIQSPLRACDVTIIYLLLQIIFHILEYVVHNIMRTFKNQNIFECTVRSLESCSSEDCFVISISCMCLSALQQELPKEDLRVAMWHSGCYCCSFKAEEKI